MNIKNGVLYTLYTINLLAQAPHVQTLQTGNFKYHQPITQANIAGGTTYVINKPGDYFLTTNLVFKAEYDEAVCISINASNVRLNLNEKSISSTNDHTHICAIEIATGQSNVVVQNGAINQVKGIGVHVNSTCNNIALRDILISNCECFAIKFENVSDCIIDQIYASHCVGQEHATTYGIYLADSINCCIQNTFCNDIRNSLGHGVGIALESCNGCLISKCIVSSVRGSTSTGIMLHNAQACLIEETRTTLQQAANGNAYGFYLEENMGTIMHSCQTQTNTAAQGNAYGFYLKNSTSTCANTCTSRDNSTGPTIGNTYGFFAESCAHCNFTTCLAFGNHSNSTDNSLCAGFALEQNSHHCNIRNSRSINNTSKGESYGIKLGTPQTYTAHCTIAQCYIEHNTGTQKQYGIKDFNPQCSTTLLNNFSAGHGKTFTYCSSIIDTGYMNYMLTYQLPEIRLNSLIMESDASNLAYLSNEKTFMNISLTT